VARNTVGDSNRAYTIGGTMAADVVGVRGISDAGSDHDAIDGHQQGLGERILDGLTGGIQLVATAVGMAGVVGAGAKGTTSAARQVVGAVDDKIDDVARTLDDVPRRVTEDAPTDPNRLYSARELIRRADEPGPYHNFPESFNQHIFQGNRQVISKNYILYTGAAV
jgi:hypothetical protein